MAHLERPNRLCTFSWTDENFLYKGIHRLELLSCSATPKAFVNCSPGQRPGSQDEIKSGNSERVPECRASHRRQRLRPDITAMKMPVSRSRTLSEFESRLVILSQGVALGWKFANACSAISKISLMRQVY